MLSMHLGRRLGTVLRYMQRLSSEASIVSKSIDIEVSAPIRRGAARIEFVGKPKVRYLVTAVPVRIMMEVAGSEAVLPYIDLKVEDGKLSWARVPSLSGYGYYRADPAAGIALASSIMQTNRYVIKSKSAKLKKFIEDIFEDVKMLELEFRDRVELLMKEAAKRKEPTVDVDLWIFLNKEGILTLDYRARGRPPFIVISVDYALPRDKVYIIPVMAYNGRDVVVKKELGDLTGHATELLNKLDIDTIFKRIQEVLHQFIKEYVKTLLVARMQML